MTEDPNDYFLFVGSADTESATTKLRASGAVYRKKMLNSSPENWLQIASMITSPHNLGTLLLLSGDSYKKICMTSYQEAALALLDALVGRPHVIFVHEKVFLTDEQRATGESPTGFETFPTSRLRYEDFAPPRPTEPDWNDDLFGLQLAEDRDLHDFESETVPNGLRQHVNTMLRERDLDVLPYRTSVERSIMASGFIEDHERHLLFRFYVPSGRLYAHEAETLLGLFREWLGQTGRRGIRQEGYSTTAGQVFEFFSAEGEPEGGLTRDFEDFSSFLDSCMSSPEVAESQLTATGRIDGPAAARIVSRFATQARRLTLDLKQRREEKLLSLKHHFENVMLEIGGPGEEGITGVLDALLPPPAAGAVMGAYGASANVPQTVNNYSQFISQVAGSVIQNVEGSAHLGLEAKQLLDLVAAHGGDERGQLVTAVHELEDDGARAPERIAARSRLRRFLADLGSRGLGVSFDVLQKYVEHKVGIS